MDNAAEQLTDLLAMDLDDGFTELVRVHAKGVHAFLLRASGLARLLPGLDGELLANAARSGREIQAGSLS